MATHASQEQSDDRFTRNTGDTHSMETRGLHKSFGSFKVLQGLDLVFQDDAITTILGPSGTGKSVLIKHLVGLLEPDDGEVLIFGEDLWKISEKQRYDLRTRMGVLFQDGALFGSLNIYDNTDRPGSPSGSSRPGRGSLRDDALSATNFFWSDSVSSS